MLICDFGYSALRLVPHRVISIATHYYPLPNSGSSTTLALSLRRHGSVGIRKPDRYALHRCADRKAVYVKVSKNTLDDVYRDQFLREWPAWKEYFANINMNDL